MVLVSCRCFTFLILHVCTEASGAYFRQGIFFMGTLHPGKDGENATVSLNSVSTSLDIVSGFFNRSIVSIRLRVV